MTRKYYDGEGKEIPASVAQPKIYSAISGQLYETTVDPIRIVDSDGAEWWIGQRPKEKETKAETKTGNKLTALAILFLFALCLFAGGVIWYQFAYMTIR